MEQANPGFTGNYRHYTDEQLIQAILEGDQRAAAYLLTEVMTPNFQYLIQCRFKDARIQPEELVNDLYLQFVESGWVALKTFRRGASLRTYLQSIARHFIYRKYFLPGTKESGSLVTLEGLGREIAVPGADMERLKTEVLELIRFLKPREQVVIRFYLQDMTPGEIAKLLGTSANAVSIIKSRACDHLKELLNNKKL